MTYNSIHIDSRDIEQSFDTVCITDWFTISLDNYAYVMSWPKFSLFFCVIVYLKNWKVLYKWNSMYALYMKNTQTNMCNACKLIKCNLCFCVIVHVLSTIVITLIRIQNITQSCRPN